MKITGFQKTGFALATAITLAVSATGVFAQDTTTPPAPVTLSATTPALSSPASQVLQLSQAKISDGTIITYVQNSGTVYGLDASQIVYLKQQGVSETVINAMLNQRTALAATAMQSPPDNSAPAAPIPPPAPTPDIAQPTTAAPSVVVVPDTQTYNYDSAYPYYYSYPYYGYYGWPGVYWGWGGGYYGGWRGGYGGGFHGGYGGGGFHGGGGGGFHGGGGGGHR